MREYNYRKITVPSHLNSINIHNEFKFNLLFNSYVSENTPYNDSKKIVKNTLKKIYNDKCAYCESSLHNEYGEIEHYRPKKSSNLSKCNSKNAYYWLAFSWDNLIPCCKICNVFKSNCFDINNENNRVKYNNQSLYKLHTILKAYHTLENPKLLHPEMDKFEDEITFYNKGQLVSKNEKVKYTLKICKLNRKKLKETREEIITEHWSNLKKYLLALVLLKKEDEISEKGMLHILSISFDKIISNSNIKKPYSMVSLYIVNNFELFVNKIPRLSNENILLLLNLWNKYKEGKKLYEK